MTARESMKVDDAISTIDWLRDTVNELQDEKDKLEDENSDLKKQIEEMKEREDWELDQDRAFSKMLDEMTGQGDYARLLGNIIKMIVGKL